MRFTKKDISGVYGIDAIYEISDRNGGHRYAGPATYKLGRLEDIEEDLGIDLIILILALENGIYVNEDYCDYSTTDNFLAPDNIDCDLKLKKLNTDLFFKDYGKTWALSKEELK